MNTTRVADRERPFMSIQTTNLYGAIAADIYDLDKPVGALPDTAFYLDRLAGVTGPILEPACGSGRALVPLAQAGHADERLRHQSGDADARRGSLRRGRGDGAPVAAGVRGLRLRPGRSPPSCCRSGSFTLIGDVSVALAVLRRFHAALEPGGLLMIDLPPLSMLSRPFQDRRSWTTPDGDLLTLEGIGTGTDWLRQTYEARYRYERWRDHRLVETQIDPMIQRAWGRTEFELALAHCGFGEVRVTGDYNRSRGVRSSSVPGADLRGDGVVAPPPRVRIATGPHTSESRRRVTPSSSAAPGAFVVHFAAERRRAARW
jgi:hypothetical protein